MREMLRSPTGTPAGTTTETAVSVTGARAATGTPANPTIDASPSTPERSD